MVTWPNFLFIVFIGQILLVSHYFPGKLLGRMKSMVFVSIAMSIFYMKQAADDVYKNDPAIA